MGAGEAKSTNCWWESCKKVCLFGWLFVCLFVSPDSRLASHPENLDGYDNRMLDSDYTEDFFASTSKNIEVSLTFMLIDASNSLGVVSMFCLEVSWHPRNS